jgi:hypothetical protein
MYGFCTVEKLEEKTRILGIEKKVGGLAERMREKNALGSGFTGV